MSDITWQQKFGLTKGKAITIGVLALTFIVVVVVQLIPSHSATAQRPEAKRKLTRRGPVKFANKSNPSNVESFTDEQLTSTTVSWPRVKIQSVLEHNPFLTHPKLVVVPPLTPEERVEQIAKAKQAEADRVEREALAIAERERAAALAAEEARKAKLIAARQARIKNKIQQLQQSGVDMFLSSGTNTIARIGGKIVREGDEFDGIKVVKIRNNGTVVLAPTTPLAN